MDLVSVIIPYYKKKNYIVETIKSVTSQSYKNLEIIIIYDDTSHSDITLIKKLKLKDKRIRLIINKKNIGAGLSRNKGIKAANGNYIAFVDSDDLWSQNKIKKQLEIMKKNNFDITHTTYYVINQNNKILTKRIAKKIIDINLLIKSCDIGLSTVLLKKSILDKKIFFPNLKTKEDFVFWIELLKKNINVYGINIPLTKWRNVSGSLSSSVIQRLKDGFTVYNKFLKMNLIHSLFYLFLLSFNALIKKLNFK